MPARPWTGHGHAPLIPLDRGAAAALVEQIYAALRDHIVHGTLRPGARLASTRAMAEHYAVSRFTIVAAIDQLRAEGYVTARRGSGIFAAAVLPDVTLRARARAQAAGHAVTSPAPPLSDRGRALSAVVISGPRQPDGPHPFHPRRPALDLFPTAVWARLVARSWRSPRLHDLDYGDPAGFRLLRQAIAEHVNLSRGLRCRWRQVVVTSGAQQAFDMLFRLLLDPGDQVWLEEPGYLDVRAALIGAGARVIPVPVDRQGLDVGAGVARAPRARLAVVSPSHQYPTGVTLSAPRRAALLDWARQADAWIIEDDYDSYFRYKGRPVPALQRFDADTAGHHAARVVYVGTFSKTMFPSLRLGFCVLPEAIVDAAVNARAIASRDTPFADQSALAAFILDGHYDRHLRRARLVYQERYDAMHAAFARELGGVLTLTPASAGTHVLGWFTPGTRLARASRTFGPRVSRAAAEEDLVAFPLSRYCLAPPPRDGFVLGYGAITPRQIAAGAARLARVITRVGTSRSRERTED